MQRYISSTTGTRYVHYTLIVTYSHRVYSQSHGLTAQHALFANTAIYHSDASAGFFGILDDDISSRVRLQKTADLTQLRRRMIHASKQLLRCRLSTQFAALSVLSFGHSPLNHSFCRTLTVHKLEVYTCSCHADEATQFHSIYCVKNTRAAAYCRNRAISLQPYLLFDDTELLSP